MRQAVNRHLLQYLQIDLICSMQYYSFSDQMELLGLNLPAITISNFMANKEVQKEKLM